MGYLVINLKMSPERTIHSTELILKKLSDDITVSNFWDLIAGVPKSLTLQDAIKFEQFAAKRNFSERDTLITTLFLLLGLRSG